MKKTFFVFALILIWLIGASCSQTSVSYEVKFESPIFDKAVRTFLVQDNGSIMSGDLNSIEKFELSKEAVGSLSLWLNDFTTELRFGTDDEESLFIAACLEDSKQLGGLKSILINEIELSGLDFLEAHKEIDYLQLFRCGVTDISSLREFKNLTALVLSGNRITDISPVSELDKLKYLSIESNPIEDMTPLDLIEDSVQIYK
jgi:Leucine-rich repeat (LRR) protein